MRTKKPIPPKDVLNYWEQSILQSGYISSFPARMRTLRSLFLHCGGSISLTMSYLKEYFPYYPCNRNTLAKLLKRYDIYQICLEVLEQDVKEYGPLSGFDDETVRGLLWRMKKRVYLRCIPAEFQGTLEEEECA